MYDEELNMALEDAYDDGYVQALIDMGIDPEDIAEEDVDIFDDNYFDEAMEGNKFNKAMKNGVMQTMADIEDMDLHNIRDMARSGSSWDRNVGRRTPSAKREKLLDGNSRSNNSNLNRELARQNARAVRRNAEDEYVRMKKGKITPDDRRRFDKAEARMYHTMRSHK